MSDGLRMLVTGGTSGIGASLARQATEAGHRVFLTGRDEGRLRALVGELDGRGEGAVSDVSDWSATEATVREAVSWLGGLDVAVANAGFTVAGDLADGDPDAWREMVLTNVLGAAHLVKAVVPPLRESHGRLILLGSVIGRKHAPGSLYSVTKHAVAALSEVARLQLHDQDVGVTLISPGRTETPFWDQLPDFPMLSPDAVARATLWAAEQPSDVDVNEILMRPRGQQI